MGPYTDFQRSPLHQGRSSRLRNFTISFYGDDDVISWRQLEPKLSQAVQNLSTLKLGHTGLSDGTLEKLVNHIAPALTISCAISALKTSLIPGGIEETFTSPRSGEEGEERLEEDTGIETASLAIRSPPVDSKYFFVSNLDLSNCNLTPKSLRKISSYVRDNACLLELYLQANPLGEDRDAMEEFAKSLGSSIVRCLNLSSCFFTPEAFVGFFDSLPESGTTLVRLWLNNAQTRGSNQEDEEEIELAKNSVLRRRKERIKLRMARSVARFLQDPARCRSLRELYLNANGFGWKGVRSIISALGFRPEVDDLFERDGDWLTEELHRALKTLRRERNKSVTKLELFGNGDFSTSSASAGLNGVVDEEEFERRRRMRRATILRLLESMQGPRSVDDGSRILSRGDEDSHDLQPNSDLEDTDQDVLQECLEDLSGVTIENCRTLEQDALFFNSYQKYVTPLAAIQVRACARILGCRSSERVAGPQRRETFPFLRLPPEIQLEVLRQVDLESPHEGCLVLSERQFRLVVSWSCDRSTIGYGDSTYDWIGRSTRDGWTKNLPVEDWDWKDCFMHRSPPRDWYAEDILFHRQHHQSKNIMHRAFLECTATS
ncbi:hypothetical protein IE53DRAFT_50695 [Violaceomyces palustris]|uniref:Uncharacterized protein n=1 Tax=Violaceomyces palustris TaxID=1673888 RepID=A0ACD0P013_9BASI|nr:hypothetical protein IE53DRAFT_50695 [Violaceomyces palustris]